MKNDERQKLKSQALELYEKRRSLAVVSQELGITLKTLYKWLETDEAFRNAKAEIDARIKAEIVEQARSTVFMSLVGLKDPTGEYYVIRPRPDIALRLLENYGKLVGFESVATMLNKTDWLDYLNAGDESQQKP